jgi:fructosamine-3-kinase
LNRRTSRPDRRFVKSVPLADAAMLDAEAEGLRALAACGAVVVPEVLETGTRGDEAFLATTWLDFADAPRGAALGRALARLHRIAQGDRYGWARDNFIGRAPQVNGWDDDWARFFRDMRLGPQFERAQRHGLRGTDALLAVVPQLLRGHAPPRSLLHGDLWSGNAAMLASGDPAIFDPAVYVGDREADIAMTHLFGGFDASFYRAYEEEWPLPDGHELRRDLYNLYHIVNHLNLFGGSYRGQAQATIDGLLRVASQ